jgi:hypothetical protein
MIDAKTGDLLAGPGYLLAPGPAAGAQTRRRLASSAWTSTAPLLQSSRLRRKARGNR